MTAMFTVDAYPNERFQGKVRQIRNAATTVQNVVTYDAVIDVANPELLLRPGMTANVTFVYARVDEGLRVPNAALRFKLDLPPSAGGRGPPDGGMRRPRDDGGKSVDRKRLWVLRGGQPEMVGLEAGLSDGTYTEVKSGSLEEGDQVIVDKQGPDGPSPGGPGRAPGAMGGGMRRVF
jgi:HlyD family secretion protein